MITAKLILAYLLKTSSATMGFDASTVDVEQAYCLAKNIYYESRNEDIKGQFAVASVTMNRVNNPRYPTTVCDVVKSTAISRATKKIVCAFSWYCEFDRKFVELPFINKNGTINQQVVDQFQVASLVAITVLSGTVEDNTNGSTHFHNPRTSNPTWRHELTPTIKVGNHNFYKEE